MIPTTSRIRGVPVEKVSLSIDTKVLAEARRLAGKRGLSAFVSDALERQLQSQRLEELLDELEGEHGPPSPEIVAEVEAKWQQWTG